MERRYGTCTFTNWKVQTKREVWWLLPISSIQCSARLRRQLPGDSIPLQGILWMFMHSSSRLTYSFVNFFSAPPFAYALFLPHTLFTHWFNQGHIEKLGDTSPRFITSSPLPYWQI